MKKNLTDILVRIIEILVERWIFGNHSLIRTLLSYRSVEHQYKQRILHDLQPQQRIIFFVFRDLHLLDWFTPIHRALLEQYQDRYQVFYIDFGSTLKQVGLGFRYFAYRGKVEKRIQQTGISNLLHFSDQEIELFKNFPDPDLIITSEHIRHENFDCRERVYLPHYSVPKAKDTLSKKLRFNHIFLPTKPPFSYNELTKQTKISAKIHQVGYPKMHLPDQTRVELFEPNKPVIIFAPSVEIKIVMDTLRKGIIQVFQKMVDLNFIIKLHPTLSAGMFDLNQYVSEKISRLPNLVLDTRNSIQALSADSAIMICDFGSVGVEYKLNFGKRLIYLDVPKYLEGGADLRFRDHFADARTDVDGLEEQIRSVLKMGKMEKEEWQEMGNKTLFSLGYADVVAAQAIEEIILKR